MVRVRISESLTRASYLSLFRYLVPLFVLLFPYGSFAGDGCVAATRGTESMHVEKIILQNDFGVSIEVEVLVADSPYERGSGFQHICPEVIDQTMILFRYRDSVSGYFHMDNVHTPLDIGFFDSEGKLIHKQLMQPWTVSNQPLYGPNRPFQFALEAKEGWFQSQSISASRSLLILEH